MEARPIPPLPSASQVRTTSSPLCSGETAATGASHDAAEDNPSATVTTRRSTETARPALPSQPARAWLAKTNDAPSAVSSSDRPRVAPIPASRTTPPTMPSTSPCPATMASGSQTVLTQSARLEARELITSAGTGRDTTNPARAPSHSADTSSSDTMGTRPLEMTSSGASTGAATTWESRCRSSGE